MVRISLDPQTILGKPTDRKQTAAIQKRVAGNRVACTVEELAAYLTSGHSFCPALFSDGTRKNTNWLEQQVFALDFDGGYRLDRFAADAAECGVVPVFAYTTFSHTPNQHRFRAVFVMDEPVRDYRLRGLLQELLIRRFPQGDRSCLDAAHLFFPGLEIHSPDYETRLDVLELLTRYEKDLAVGDIHNHGTRALKSFYKKCNVEHGFRSVNLVGVVGVRTEDAGKLAVKRLAHKYIPEETENTPDSPHTTSSILLDPSCDAFVKFTVTENEAKRGVRRGRSAASRNPSRAEPMRVEKSELVARCELLRDFDSSSRKLSHQQLRLLALNLRHIRGGEKWFKERLSAMPDTSAEKQREWAYYLKWFDEAGYRPEGCDGGNCPYADTCRHGKNLLDRLDLRRHAIRHVGGEPERSLPDAVRLALAETMRRFREAKDSKVHVLRSDPGIGKTEELLNGSLSSTLVAFPTHKLKNEANRRAMEKGHSAIYLWPERPFLPEPWQSRIVLYDRLKLYDALEEELDAFLNQCEDARLSTEVETYRQQRSRIHYYHSVFCTHAKSHITANSAADTYVIDEDLTGAFLNIVEVSREDIRRIYDSASARTGKAARQIRKLLDNVMNATVNRVATLRDRKELAPLTLELVKHLPLNTPVSSLLREGFYTRDDNGNILLLEKKSLLPDKKYIVLSATANEAIYAALFGARLDFVSLPPVQTKGRVMLHRSRSFSRSSIENMGERFFSYVTEKQRELGFDGIITFKHLAEERQACLYLKGTDVPVLATFGALEGLDSFKGKSIGIFGTPHYTEQRYRLYAAALGLHLPAEAGFAERAVARNGYEFTFNCFSEDEAVQNLQLWLIESELIQAVGRARLIDHETEVHLFSNFPLPYCELVEEKKVTPALAVAA